MGKLFKQNFLNVFVWRTIYSGESQFKTSSIFAATVVNHAYFPETSLFHLDVYSTLHRGTLTHILPILQVRSNWVISFMAITTALAGISKCGSYVSYLGRGFFKFFTFSAFFSSSSLNFHSCLFSSANLLFLFISDGVVPTRWVCHFIY